MVSKQVEEELTGFPSAMDPTNVPTNDSPPIDLLSTASLKKKEVETKTSKRKRNWLDKRRKVAKKGGKKKEKKVAVHKTTAVQDTAIVRNIYPSTSLSMKEMSEPYMAINTFSQMLMVIFQIST